MRKYCMWLGIFFTITLNGCAGLDNYIEKGVKEASGILEDENYVSYQKKVESGNVDEEGYYIQNGDQSEKIGSVHVTFATNNKLDVQYFEDAEGNVVIDTSSYYLNSGDSIYAKVANKKDSDGIYEFLAFDIYEYENGEKRYNYIGAVILKQRGECYGYQMILEGQRFLLYQLENTVQAKLC